MQLRRSAGEGLGRLLQVVVTCSERKRLPTPENLRLRHIVGSNLAERARAWVDALDGFSSPRLPALDLYQGEHWSVVRSLARAGEAAGLAVDLWVVSAGYGLVPAYACLKPYGATFAPGHPDSVRQEKHMPGRDALSRWWSLLGRWPGPQPDAPRSLEELAQRHVSSTILVACSEAYFTALAPDLRAATTRLASPESLFVISAGASTSGALAASVVPADARLQRLFGGARLSLNARILRWVIESAPVHRFVRSEVVALVREELVRQEPLPRYDRMPLSDQEVVTLIRSGLKEQPGASRTALLRVLRDAGFACEQRRFGVLYDLAMSVAR